MQHPGFMPESRPSKFRLDRLLVERGLAESREKAQAMILSGQVLVDHQKVEKCGVAVDAQAVIDLLGEPPKYVGRVGSSWKPPWSIFPSTLAAKSVWMWEPRQVDLPTASCSVVRAECLPLTWASTS